MALRTDQIQTEKNNSFTGLCVALRALDDDYKRYEELLEDEYRFPSAFPLG